MDALCVSVSVSIQAMHSCYLFRLFIHAIYSGNSFMLSLFRQFIHAIYSGNSFMLSIQAIHSCYLFRLFIHAIYSGYSFMLSIQAIHSGYLFRLSIQDTSASGPSEILSFSSFRTHKLRVQAKFWLFYENIFFKDRLKRCFDSGFVIYAKCRVDLYPGFIQRCFLRRVMAEQR